MMLRLNSTRLEEMMIMLVRLPLNFLYSLLLGVTLGKKDHVALAEEKRMKAHQYVLFNCSSVEPFIKEHKEIVEQRNPRLNRKDVEQLHCETFSQWFYNHVESLHLMGV